MCSKAAPALVTPVTSILVRPYRFAALLAQLLALGEGLAKLVHHAENPWASATFAGSRHRFTLAFCGDAAVRAGENLIAHLPDHEFTIPGQLVADAAVTAAHSAQTGGQTLTVDIEILLLNDT